MIGLLNTRIYCCNPGHTAFIRALSTSQLKEYYDALRVEKSSTPKEIKESFLKLSKIYHPDNKKTGSHMKFVKLKEAYDAIKDGPPKTTPSNTSSYYHDPQDYDLSHKAHARYRQQERDYTSHYDSQDYGFGGPYAKSQRPWEELMRDKAYRRQQESGFGSRGKPLASLTLFLGAIAWIVIYSSILLVWDYNDNVKDSYTKHRSRHKDEYMSFDSYLRRREAARRDRLSHHYQYRPMEERTPTTKPETASEQETSNNSEETPLVSPTH